MIPLHAALHCIPILSSLVRVVCHGWRLITSSAKGKAEFFGAVESGMGQTEASPVKNKEKALLWEAAIGVRDSKGDKLNRLDHDQTGGVYRVQRSSSLDEADPWARASGDLAVFKPKDEEGFSRGG